MNGPRTDSGLEMEDLSLVKKAQTVDGFSLVLETFSPRPLLFLDTFVSKGNKHILQAKRYWLILAMHNCAINI